MVFHDNDTELTNAIVHDVKKEMFEKVDHDSFVTVAL